jgi:hypothetical protein
MGWGSGTPDLRSKGCAVGGKLINASYFNASYYITSAGDETNNMLFATLQEDGSKS